jgi:hypothetical protein
LVPLCTSIPCCLVRFCAAPHFPINVINVVVKWFMRPYSPLCNSVQSPQIPLRAPSFLTPPWLGNGPTIDGAVQSWTREGCPALDCIAIGSDGFGPVRRRKPRLCGLTRAGKILHPSLGALKPASSGATAVPSRCTRCRSGVSSMRLLVQKRLICVSGRPSWGSGYSHRQALSKR